MDIVLKRIQLADAPFIQQWKGDQELSELIMSHPVHLSIPETEQWIKKNSDDPGQRLFGIYVKNDEKEEKPILVGVLRLMFLDFDAGTTELGVYIGDRSYWGKGIGEYVIKRGVNLTFDDLGLMKIYIKVNNSNQASMNTFLKLGFEKEGTLRKHFFNRTFNRFDNVNLLALFNVNSNS